MKIAIDVVDGKVKNVFSNAEDVEVYVCYFGHGVETTDEEEDEIENIVASVPNKAKIIKQYRSS